MKNLNTGYLTTIEELLADAQNNREEAEESRSLAGSSVSSWKTKVAETTNELKAASRAAAKFFITLVKSMLRPAAHAKDVLDGYAATETVARKAQEQIDATAHLAEAEAEYAASAVQVMQQDDIITAARMLATALDAVQSEDSMSEEPESEI